jgi:hypothetical protein
MPRHAQKTLPGLATLRTGERDGDADHEHEARLDEIPQRAALPGLVFELRPDGFPKRTRIRLGHLHDAKTGRGHQKHDEAAKSIEGEKSG